MESRKDIMNPKDIKDFLDFTKNQPKGTVYGDSQSEKTEPLTKQQQLDNLKQKHTHCTLCPLSGMGRANVVFGHGNPDAKLMFVGEGPGRDEDLQALPFVGRAGKLLTKIIEAMKLTRKEVYISNIVKCRPPQNRAPLPNESQICKNTILFKEIEIIKPKIICTLGATATQELLEKPISITKIRGTFIPFRNTLLMPTFHPAYLLRNPQKKEEVWIDMQKIMEKLSLFK